MEEQRRGSPQFALPLIVLVICCAFPEGAEPSKLTITRQPNGPELSSPVVVGTGQTLTIYCAAVNTDSPGTVRGLHWRFPNNSRVPESDINSEYDVGMVVYLENNRWIGLLRMNRVQLSSAGIYTCVANFSGVPKSRSMEIQVSACSDPGTLTNGRLRLTNSTTVKYTCDTGYNLRGASTRHCTANNPELTGLVPRCIPVSCGPAPKAPASGQGSGSGTTFGSTVTYTCNPGYNLQGDSRRNCMANGQWSGSTPTCSAIRCVLPPFAPVYGRRNVTGLTLGSTLIYSCKAGYTLNGSSTITCMANRQWSGNAPDCSPVSCVPAPKAPENGQRTVSGTTFGSTVTYTCNRGYTLPGDNRRTCMANRQWSGRTPTCSAVSCSPAPNAPANGQRNVSGTIYGSTVIYTCNRGYTLQGDNTRTCMANGQWSGTTPTCNPVSCGPAPDAPANGRRSGSGTTFRSTVTYTCNQGYTREGPSRVTCTDNKRWSGTSPTCSRTSCGPAPDAPANGQRSGSGTTVGSTVIYTCSRGYTLQGDNSHTCMANGHWSGKAPTCNPVRCGPAPDAPANGRQSSSDTTFRSTVTYRCDRGYTLQGPSSVTCMANKLWSGRAPTCNPVSCVPAPDAPANGQQSGSGTTFGSTVTYTCNQGYTLQGDNRRTCMANGQWSGRTPSCGVIICGPAPNAPANGHRSGSGRTVGSTVTYTCNRGYTLQGDNRRTCMANGQWSGVTPRCSPTIPLATISSTSPSVTTILVNWLTPFSDLGDIHGFTLFWTGLAGQDGGSVTTPSHYYTIVGLSPATGYSIVVQVNAVLGDMNSTAVQAYTLPEVNNTIRVVSDFTTSFEVALNLSLAILPDNVESIAVWYSTKGHEGSPTAPPQDAHVVHGGNMTSLKIALPDSSDPCQPYHIWVAGFASNGQRGPYSKRRRVEVCSRTDDGQSSAATGNGANVVTLGIFLGGLVAGIVLILLVEGIVFGVMKLRRHGKVTKSAKEMKEDENTYETVEPKQSAALSDHVAMETNPAYASVH